VVLQRDMLKIPPRFWRQCISDVFLFGRQSRDYTIYEVHNLFFPTVSIPAFSRHDTQLIFCLYRLLYEAIPL
jgi:hypothetical protein